MRAIEFRFYDPFNEVMIYSYDFLMLSDFFASHDKAFHGGNEPALTQYTGLKDAKGNKVYEGDLIKNSADIIMVVFWDNEASAFFKKLLHHEGNEYAVGIRNMKFWNVIGNKYQHGELLNEQKTANIGTDRDG